MRHLTSPAFPDVLLEPETGASAGVPGGLGMPAARKLSGLGGVESERRLAGRLPKLSALKMDCTRL